jgi:hypothetical protein
LSEITLVVTLRELEHAEVNPKEKQIAMRSPSDEIAAALRGLSLKNRAHLSLGGFLTLDVVDPGAIWLAHNDKHSEAFAALWVFLATRPDREMRFLCEVSPLSEKS